MSEQRPGNGVRASDNMEFGSLPAPSDLTPGCCRLCGCQADQPVHGTGPYQHIHEPDPRSAPSNATAEPCDSCQGVGEGAGGHRCPDCGGAGRVAVPEYLRRLAAAPAVPPCPDCLAGGCTPGDCDCHDFHPLTEAQRAARARRAAERARRAADDRRAMLDVRGRIARTARRAGLAASKAGRP